MTIAGTTTKKSASSSSSSSSDQPSSSECLASNNVYAKEQDNCKRMRAAHAANASIARQVSHDGLLSISIVDSKLKAMNKKKDGEGGGGPGSPVRCVSEFDKVTTAKNCIPSTPPPPPFENPLHNPKLLQLHTRALTLEANLHPMRLILSRLMNHTTLNRKGIFNTPVDTVALNIPDYLKVITRPMDFGTIKVKLHAVAYHSREEVDVDIRLVFANAMKYNPPSNAVHMAARELLQFYQGQCQAFVPNLVEKKMEVESTIESSAELKSNAKEVEAVSSSCGIESSSCEAVSACPLSTSEAIAPLAPVASQVPSMTASIAALATCTRNSAAAGIALPSATPAARKRKKRGSKVNVSHSCDRCLGRTCAMCQQGCLTLEPTLLICNGVHCSGSRIRKGATYFIAKDGSRQYCQRCHASLPAVLPVTGQDDGVRYKRDLLKRKNDEEIAERWLQCSKCDSPVHQMCVIHDEYIHDEAEYACPSCVVSQELPAPTNETMEDDCLSTDEDLYTFVSGSEVPVKLSDVTGGVSVPLSADALPETDVSAFIQEKVRMQMKSSDIPNVEKTAVIRVISDCERCFTVPDVIRKHFRMVSSTGDDASPPMRVNYRSKAIALFQKVDGLDICIFCMYVHEYDGDDEYEEDRHGDEHQNKRVYIAYLDSVEHFRPRACRTNVYQEILVSYLATARERGYENAHIWACPPSRGNSFVFWNHPASQRTPNKDRLVAWYHGAVSRAVECGVVTDVRSLFESDFQEQLKDLKTSEVPLRSIVCPPLLDGDFWIEEAVRIHRLNMSRQLKPKTSDTDLAPTTAEGLNDRCPAMQIATLLRERIVVHASAVPFRRPVNAVALKLKDYHQIISKPMDFGSVYSCCMLGEYRTVGDLVADVELVFSNAKRYNPKGHVVHTKAIEVRDFFFKELNDLVATWSHAIPVDDPSNVSWKSFAKVSMSLDKSLFECADDQSNDVDNDDSSRSSSVTRDPSSSTKDGAEELSLFSGGAAAVEQRMVGEDRWLLEKTPYKTKADSSKKSGRRRKMYSEPEDEPMPKRRRQSWLSLEVGSSVRRMRASFFTCSLRQSSKMSAEEAEKAESFSTYSRDFSRSRADSLRHAKIADLRHALIEFSQFRHLEFDTVRHAKYSTAVILYHLHTDVGVGILPSCSSCCGNIGDVRWHKVGKIVEHRHHVRGKPPKTKASFQPEELCTPCYSKHSHKENFIPVQVSFPQTNH
jgi:hypothetical protein